MTAISRMTGRNEPGTRPPGRLSWLRLASATLRQRTGSLAAYAAFAIVVAVAMVVTGLVLHGSGQAAFSAGPHSLWWLYDPTWTSLRLVLLLMPVLAGLFLGAPLVAREIETGTARFAWAQGAGRIRWLIAAVMPVALLLTFIAVGLGFELRWWTDALTPYGRWWGSLFSLNPLPFTGWMLMGFSLGVVMGAAIRRSVPAMAATLACYLPLALYELSLGWQRSYLPPLHQRAVDVTIGAGGGYGYGVPLRSGGGPGPEILSSALGWPSGRLLTNAQLHHPATWFRAHHIQVWVTYQPGSRFFLFECIEFGLVIALSAIFIGLTVLLIRRGTS